MRRAQALILCGNARAHLGVRASLRGTCQAIRAIEPGLRIVAASPDPDGALDEVIEDPRKLAAAARASALVLVTTEFLAPLRWRDRLVWGQRLARLRRRGVRVAGLALILQTAQPWHRRPLTRLALRGLQELGMQEPDSLEIAARVARAPVFLLPDPAFLAAAGQYEQARARLAALGLLREDGVLVGFAPDASAIVGAPLETRWREVLAEALDRILEEHDASLLCLPITANDARLCRDLLERMQAERAQIATGLDPAMYKSLTSLLAVMLCTRRAAAVLATSVGRPVVSVTRDPVSISLLGMLGEPHQRLDPDLFVRGKLIGQLAELVSAGVRARRAPLQRIEELKAQTLDGLRRLAGGLELATWSDRTP